MKVQAGHRYGRLKVLGLEGDRATRYPWLCQCDCGQRTTVIAERLRSGKTKSCGCLRREITQARGEANKRHGMKGSPTHRCWSAMMARHRKTTGPYANITVCEQWLTFENFLADMGERPSLQHSIDRYPNNQGNYEPSNCRWATAKQQANNRRNNKC